MRYTPPMSEPACRAPRPRLEGLTGLRFFAALHVVFYHFGATAVADAPGWLRDVQEAGHTAVSLFFVLSGFVLAYNYGEPLARGEVSWRRFFWARLTRVYPLYALTIVIELPLQHHAGVSAARIWSASTAQLMGLQAWIPQITFFGNSPGWSISVELFFYALFPWLATRLGARPGELALWIAVALGAAALPALPGLSEPAARFAKCAPLIRLPELIVGLLLGRLYLLRPRRVPSGDAKALVALVLLGAGFALQARVPRWFLHGLLVPPFALLIWGVAEGGRLARLLSWPPLRRLGEASYALYLWQMVLFQALGGRYEWGWPPLAGYLALLMLVALVSHACVEGPAQRWLRQAVRR